MTALLRWRERFDSDENLLFSFFHTLLLVSFLPFAIFILWKCSLLVHSTYHPATGTSNFSSNFVSKLCFVILSYTYASDAKFSTALPLADGATLIFALQNFHFFLLVEHFFYFLSYCTRFSLLFLICLNTFFIIFFAKFSVLNSFRFLIHYTNHLPRASVPCRSICFDTWKYSHIGIYIPIQFEMAGLLTMHSHKFIYISWSHFLSVRTCCCLIHLLSDGGSRRSVREKAE